MKTHIFYPDNPMSFIWNLAIFKLACNTNNIRKGAGMWVLPFFIKHALETILNSHMSAGPHITPVDASVSNSDPQIQK